MEKNAETAIVAAPQQQGVTVFNADTEMPDVSTLAKAKKAGVNIAFEYHEFTQGEEIRGVFMGITDYTFKSQYTGDLQTIAAVVFVNEKNQIRLNGASRFVGALKGLPNRTPFVATMTGITPKKGKNIQNFDVFLLQ